MAEGTLELQARLGDAAVPIVVSYDKNDDTFRVSAVHRDAGARIAAEFTITGASVLPAGDDREEAGGSVHVTSYSGARVDERAMRLGAVMATTAARLLRSVEPKRRTAPKAQMALEPGDGPFLSFDETSAANAPEVARLLDRASHGAHDVFDFTFEARWGDRTVPVYVDVRSGDTADDVFSVHMKYTDGGVVVDAVLTVARAINAVDVRHELLIRSDSVVDAERATEEVHAHGGVMIRTLRKFDEDASDEEMGRAKGIVMTLIAGGLLPFLVRIGLCGLESRVYVHAGTLSSHGARPKVDESGRPKELASLVAYYRRLSFEPMDSNDDYILTTTVSRLVAAVAASAPHGHPRVGRARAARFV